MLPLASYGASLSYPSSRLRFALLASPPPLPPPLLLLLLLLLLLVSRVGTGLVPALITLAVRGARECSCCLRVHRSEAWGGRGGEERRGG
jgi:hypothetical protein